VALSEASATFEPIVTYDDDVDFDSFVHMALSDVASFDLLDDPEDDVGSAVRTSPSSSGRSPAAAGGAPGACAHARTSTRGGRRV